MILQPQMYLEIMKKDTQDPHAMVVSQDVVAHILLDKFSIATRRSAKKPAVHIMPVSPGFYTIHSLFLFPS